MPTSAEVLQGSVAVQNGREARVGVVILHWGGPDALENVDSFLRNVYEDPAMVRLPGGRRLRPVFSRAAWSIQRKTIRKQFAAVGGYSPEIRLASEQARGLESRLQKEARKLRGAEFKTYVAMQHWHPTVNAAVRELERDRVDQVVLVPGFLHRFKAGSDNALARWTATADSPESPSWPTHQLNRLASHPLVLRAVSERVHQALQRFPRLERDRVRVMFAASGIPCQEETEYYRQVQEMADIIMGLRGQSAPADVAFYGHYGPINGKGPNLKRKIEAMARNGARNLLVVPLCSITDTLHTTQFLDMACRKSAEKAGILQYEVAQALNSHGLFLQALAEMVVRQLALPTSEAQVLA